MPEERSEVERLEWDRPAELPPGVEIFRGDGCRRRFTVFHESYAVSAVYASSGDWLYRGRIYWMRPSGLSMMEPGEVHRNLRTYGVSRFRVVFLPPTLVLQAALELGLPASPPRLRTPQVDDPSLFHAFRKLHRALEERASVLERQSRFDACLHLYLSRCMERVLREPDPTGGRPGVRRAVELLRSDLARNFSLQELSRAAELSRFHFLRAFTRQVGVPPHEYQIQLRVAAARRLLREGRRTVDVALDLGFADQSHFTRHFKRIVGVPPAKYARS